MFYPFELLMSLYEVLSVSLCEELSMSLCEELSVSLCEELSLYEELSVLCEELLM